MLEQYKGLPSHFASERKRGKMQKRVRKAFRPQSRPDTSEWAESGGSTIINRQSETPTMMQF